MSLDLLRSSCSSNLFGTQFFAQNTKPNVPSSFTKIAFRFFFASRLDFTRPACRSKCFKLCPSSLCFPLFCSHTHAHVAIYFIGNNEAAPEQQQQRQDRSGDEDDNREKDLEPMLYRTRYLTALKFTGRLYGWTQCLLRGVWLKPSPRNPASLVAMETQSRAVNCW